MHALRAHMDQLEHALPGQLNSSSKLVAQKREENVSVFVLFNPRGMLSPAEPACDT